MTTAFIIIQNAFVVLRDFFFCRSMARNHEVANTFLNGERLARDVRLTALVRPHEREGTSGRNGRARSVVSFEI